MSALLFIQRKRMSVERIDMVGALRIAMNGSKQEVEKCMERWARDAEIRLTFEE